VTDWSHLSPTQAARIPDDVYLADVIIPSTPCPPGQNPAEARRQTDQLWAVRWRQSLTPPELKERGCSLSEEQQVQAHTMFVHGGNGLQEIARAVGTTRRTIERLVERKRWERLTPLRKRAPRKVSAEVEELVRLRAAEGVSMRQLQEEFDLAMASVRRILGMARAGTPQSQPDPEPEPPQREPVEPQRVTAHNARDLPEPVERPVLGLVGVRWVGTAA
jgi:transposase